MRHRTGACPTSACGHPAAAQPWRYLPRAHCNRHMQSACCSGRNYLRDQLREMEVRTASSGARAYCTTSVLQHHDAVGVRVTRRTPEAAASWPNRRSCVATAAGMALGPPTTPQLPSSGSRGSQRIWAREIPKRLLLLAFGRSGRPDLPSRDGDTADRTTGSRTNRVSGDTFLPGTHLFRALGQGGTQQFRCFGMISSGS